MSDFDVKSWLYFLEKLLVGRDRQKEFIKDRK